MEGDILWGIDPERDRRLERHALGRYLAAVGFTMLLFLLAALSTSLPVDLLRRYWQGRGVPVTQTMTQLVNMASYCYSLLLPLLFLVLFRGPGRTGRPLFPLGRPRRGILFPALGICLGVCSLSNYLSTWVSVLIQERFPDTLPAHQATLPSEGLPLVLGLISAAVLPAILEELLFRGAILQGARPFGDGFAILLSALAFALCHTTVPQLIPAFLAGLLFGFFAVLSGSLWVTIAIHCCYNLLASAVELAGTLGGSHTQLAVSVSIAALSLLYCLGGCLVLSVRLRGGRLLEPYRGVLTPAQRFRAAGCSIPLLIAIATLCWTTWRPLLEEVLGR